LKEDEIIELARQAGVRDSLEYDHMECDAKSLEAFAKLVAKHTLMNIDPSKFISWQEGFEAGRFAERKACAKIGDGFHDDEANCGDLIRAKGKA
jgi:hypothetical protein